MLTSVCEVQVGDLSVQARDQSCPLGHGLQRAEGLGSLEPEGGEREGTVETGRSTTDRNNAPIRSQERQRKERERV